MIKKLNTKETNQLINEKLNEITKEDMKSLFASHAMENIKSKIGESGMKKHEVTEENAGLEKWMEIARAELNR